MTTTPIESSVEVTTAPLPQRILGKTGEPVPILGLGTGPGGIGMADEDAIPLYHRAIDLGVTYIDTAPGYVNAHRQLGEVLRRRRDEVFLVTKTAADTADDALRVLEKGLDDLQTDHADLVYVHHMGGRDVDKVLSLEGALAGLRKAQSRGWTRFVGVTAHNQPWKVARVIKEADVDVIMVALNPGDLHTYDFQGEVLNLARKQNAGVAAMKVYGGAEGMKYQLAKGERSRPSELEAEGYSEHELALRYALGLEGVAIAVIGMYTETELLKNIELVRRYQPLSEAQHEEAITAGRSLSKAWGTHFGPVE